MSALVLSCDMRLETATDMRLKTATGGGRSKSAEHKEPFVNSILIMLTVEQTVDIEFSFVGCLRNKKSVGFRNVLLLIERPLAVTSSRL